MPCSTSLAGSTLAYTVGAVRFALRAVTMAVTICVRLSENVSQVPRGNPVSRSTHMTRPPRPKTTSMDLQTKRWLLMS